MDTNQERDQWVSRKGFIFAAVGAAIGLGNLWRFPFQAYANGGGAFLFPYLFALLTAAIPLMIMEYAFGSKMRGAAALSYRKLGKKWEWFGWWQVMIPVVVMMFYCTVVSWSLNYIIFSFTQSWGDDPGKFFGVDFLKVTDSPWNLGGINWRIMIATIFVWFCNWFITRKGISGGIEKACKIFTPLLVVLMIVFMIRGVTLEGAVIGLNNLFKPDFSKLLDASIWVSAYGQVFFSTTIAVGVMIAYSSYLPRKTDIANNACITVLSNASFDLIAGITVFSTLGFIAHSTGVSFKEVAQGGPGVAFVAFPQAISKMPTMQIFIGVLFFFCLFIAGLSSSLSMLESFSSSILDKFDISRKKLVNIVCLIGFTGSSLYATGAGVLILDIVDHFVANFGIALCGLIEAIILGYFLGTKEMREYINENSDFKIGVWWDITIKYITPLVLGFMFISNIVTELKSAYSGYPMSAIIVMGWSVAIGMLIMGIILGRKKWSKEL